MNGLQVAAIITAIGGFGGVLIAALRYKREDTGQLVAQQATILTGMRDLNVELRIAHDRCGVVIAALEGKALVEAEKLREQAEELKEVRGSLARALDKVAELTKEADNGG